MVSSKYVLITRPNHDAVTDCLYFWTQQIVDIAGGKGFIVLDLSGKKANRSTFLSYLKKRDPVLVFFNGHGSDSVIAGYDNETLIGDGNTVKLLFGKIIYARSCDAAKVLGVESIKHGALAFIGYKEKYWLATSEDKLTKPLQDSVAKLFLEPSNLVPSSLIKGNSAKEAYRKSQEAATRNISYMLSTAATDAEREAVPYLHSNRLNQVLLGDGSA